MNTGFISMSDSEKKLNIITAVLLLVGTVTSICLVFFFIQLFKARNDSVIPQIFNAEQLGATDTSVLIAWSSSEAAHEFVVRYRSAGSNSNTEYKEFKTEQPFAALHDLQPDTRYQTQIIPIDKGVEWEPFELTCDTSPFCHVTEVSVSDITDNGVTVKWKYDGIDEGFKITAYAVDQNGKRHLTSPVVTIPKGAGQECVLENLVSELRYTVCVIPCARYATVGKSTFTTSKYSNKYNEINSVRFVICSYESANSMYVGMINHLAPGQPYKTSMIIGGKADPSDKADLMIYITDADGTIVSNFIQKDVSLNPNGVTSSLYISLLSDFTAPEQPGNYSIFASFNGKTVAKNLFKVV